MTWDAGSSPVRVEQPGEGLDETRDGHATANGLACQPDRSRPALRVVEQPGELLGNEPTEPVGRGPERGCEATVVVEVFEQQEQVEQIAAHLVLASAPSAHERMRLGCREPCRGGDRQTSSTTA